MRTEIQFTDGEAEQFKRVFVKASGWVVTVHDENGHEYKTHYPPHKIERILGEAKHQSPHGSI